MEDDQGSDRRNVSSRRSPGSPGPLNRTIGGYQDFEPTATSSVYEADISPGTPCRRRAESPRPMPRSPRHVDRTGSSYQDFEPSYAPDLSSGGSPCPRRNMSPRHSLGTPGQSGRTAGGYPGIQVPATSTPYPPDRPAGSRPCRRRAESPHASPWSPDQPSRTIGGYEDFSPTAASSPYAPDIYSGTPACPRQNSFSRSPRSGSPHLSYSQWQQGTDDYEGVSRTPTGRSSLYAGDHSPGIQSCPRQSPCAQNQSSGSSQLTYSQWQRGTDDYEEVLGKPIARSSPYAGDISAGDIPCPRNQTSISPFPSAAGQCARNNECGASYEMDQELMEIRENLDYLKKGTQSCPRQSPCAQNQSSGSSQLTYSQWQRGTDDYEEVLGKPIARSSPYAGDISAGDIPCPRNQTSISPFPSAASQCARNPAGGCKDFASLNNECGALYEMDPELIEIKENQDYIVSIKSAMSKTSIARNTVMEHFHQLMKETLGERIYSALLKKGVLNKNLPDEVVTRKILDALELKNKLLFTNDPTSSATDKMNLIQAAGSFRGAMRAAIAATASVDDEFVEGIAEREAMNHDGVFTKRNKPAPEIKVLGYIGLTKNA